MPRRWVGSTVKLCCLRAGVSASECCWSRRCVSRACSQPAGEESGEQTQAPAVQTQSCVTTVPGGGESGTRDYQKGPVWLDAVLIAPVAGYINRFCAIRVQVTQAGRHLIAKVQLLVPAAGTTDHLRFPPSRGQNQELAQTDVFHFTVYTEYLLICVSWELCAAVPCGDLLVPSSRSFTAH